MQKLINGIIEFQKNVLPSYRETFARLALKQSPDALFIACSDSRVVPNLFASLDPGDLFVVRNVGNLVPPCAGDDGLSVADESAAAAIEFAVGTLGVRDIIVCGHSDCGAMHALLNGREKVRTPNLKGWLRHGDNALDILKGTNRNEKLKDHEFATQLLSHFDPKLTPNNQLAQLNVLEQVENLASYPIVQERLLSKKLRLHAWWFDLSDATVHYFDPSTKRYTLIDETRGEQILKSLE